MNKSSQPGNGLKEAFEALSQEKKQDLVNQESQRLLREHPEYADRAQLPGWEQSFRSRAIKALLGNRQHTSLSLPSPEQQ